MIADTVGWLADHWLLALAIWAGSSLASGLLWAATCELFRSGLRAGRAAIARLHAARLARNAERHANKHAKIRRETP